jgi:hypothetical protein
MVEFSLVFLPLTAVLLGIFEVGRFAWTYQTMAAAVKSATRFYSVRGAQCAAISPECVQRVGGLVEVVKRSGVGLDPSQLSLALLSGSSTKTCAPATACAGDSSVWPPAPQNAVGMSITVRASYPVHPLGWLISSPATGFTLTAASQEVIQF